MSETVYVLVHHDGEITETDEGVKFRSPNPVLITIHSSITLAELHSRILQKLYQQSNKQIAQLLYRLPIAFGRGVIRYQSFQIGSDEDIGMMFNCRGQFPEIRIMELFVVVVDPHLSSGASAPEPGSVAMPQLERSPALVVASPVPNEYIQTEDDDELVGGPSFAQLAMEIAGPLQGEGPMAGYDFIIDGGDGGDDEDEPAEIPADSDGSDGETVPLTQSQPSIRPSQLRLQSLSFEHVPHYGSLNLEAMQERPFDVADASTIEGEPGANELQIGQLFPDKEAVLFAVKSYSIRRSVEYKVLESDHLKYHGKCKHFGSGCNWSIRVTYRQKKRLWEVRKYNGPHTCLAASLSQDHRQLDSNVICASIFSMVQADPTISIKVLQASVEAKYGFKITYRKVWLAKQKAIARVYGDWEDSYNELPRWLQGLQAFNPGTIAQLVTLPYYVGNFVDHSCVMFHRLFWTFAPCIEAFKYCKPLITVDGTHLYGKYGGTLLMAIAQDGNSNILPVAFAVVEKETRDAWSFFLTNLRQYVTPQHGIMIISDRHAAIKAALSAEGSGWHPPLAHHAYCIRHIVSNFALTFKSKDAKRALMNAAYAKTRGEHLYYRGLLRDENPAMCEWIDRISLQKWAQHADEGKRFGHMTTNLSECINAVLKGTRNLPITAMVKSTFFRLTKLFVKKGKEARAQLASGQLYSQALVRAIEFNRQHIGTMAVTGFSRSDESFMVEELQPIGSWTQKSYRVNLSARWCDCGYFQALHYPCRHVLAACAYARLDWGIYVHDVYRMQSVFNVYGTEFSAISNEDYWPEYSGVRIRPNPELRRATEGRPVSTRIRNEMDEVEPGPGKRCGLCRQEGHSRRRCPTLHASSSN